MFQPKPELPPYLVLLRVGFALPAALLQRRCALTAPFHPYPVVVLSLQQRPALQAHNDDEAVCSLWHFPSTGLEPSLPDVIRHTALRSSDFPPRPFWEEHSNQSAPARMGGATVRSGCLQPLLYAMVLGARYPRSACILLGAAQANDSSTRRTRRSSLRSR